jgi:hypothetical protein
MKKIKPFPSTAKEFDWYEKFDRLQQVAGIKYDAAQVLKTHFQSGLTPAEVVNLIKYRAAVKL